MADTKLTGLSEISVPALADTGYAVDVSDTTDDAAGSSRQLTLTRMLGLMNHVCQGRLTLTTAVPVTTSDVTGATSIYWTPYNGNMVSLYDGTRWRMYSFSELTLALGTITTLRPYDVFLYDNSGTLTLELLAWTNDTARATALVLQDGVWCKTGALTRRYLGTFRTTSTTTTEDSVAKRFLWNAYNRERRMLRVHEATASWTYGSATWRQTRAQAANQVEAVIGLAGMLVELEIPHHWFGSSNAAIGAFNSIGEDSTTSPSANAHGGQTITHAASDFDQITVIYKNFMAVGYHYWAWLEKSVAVGTNTFYGDSSGDRIAGIIGSIMA